MKPGLPRHPAPPLTILALVLSCLALTTGGVVAAQKYDARNAEKVDGLSAVRGNIASGVIRGKLVAVNDKGRFPASVLPVTRRVVTIQAQGLNIGDQDTPTRSETGLNWDHTFVGGAQLWQPRPAGWDGKAVTLKVVFTAGGTGVVGFFARAQSLDVGDPFLEVDSLPSGVTTLNGPGTPLAQVAIRIPAALLQGDVWNVQLQRDSELPNAFTGDVVVRYVQLEYGAAG